MGLWWCARALKSSLELHTLTHSTITSLVIHILFLPICTIPPLFRTNIIVSRSQNFACFTFIRHVVGSLVAVLFFFSPFNVCVVLQLHNVIHLHERLHHYVGRSRQVEKNPIKWFACKLEQQLHWSISVQWGRPTGTLLLCMLYGMSGLRSNAWEAMALFIHKHRGHDIVALDLLFFVRMGLRRRRKKLSLR